LVIYDYDTNSIREPSKVSFNVLKLMEKHFIDPCWITGLAYDKKACEKESTFTQGLNIPKYGKTGEKLT
jgi:hypothetical protein